MSIGWGRQEGGRRGRRVVAAADHEDRRLLRSHAGPVRTVRMDRDHGGHAVIRRRVGADLQNAAAALAVAEDPDAPGIDDALVLAARGLVLLRQPLQAADHVDIAGRPRIGGDDDRLEVDGPFDQAGQVALQSRLAGDVVPAPAVQPSGHRIGLEPRIGGAVQAPGPDVRHFGPALTDPGPTRTSRAWSGTTRLVLTGVSGTAGECGSGRGVERPCARDTAGGSGVSRPVSAGCSVPPPRRSAGFRDLGL